MSEEMTVGKLKRMLENLSEEDTIRFERKSGTFLPYMEYVPHEQWHDDEDKVLIMTFVEIGDEKWLERIKNEDITKQ